MHLQIPKLPKGTYCPGFLKARHRSEQALASVIQEVLRAWGQSARKLDELVQTMGMIGISESAVSRICQELDERAHAFRERGPDGDVWLDAKYLGYARDIRVMSTTLSSPGRSAKPKGADDMPRLLPTAEEDLGGVQAPAGGGFRRRTEARRGCHGEEKLS